jgi:hypothetical protein
MLEHGIPPLIGYLAGALLASLSRAAFRDQGAVQGPPPGVGFFQATRPVTTLKIANLSFGSTAAIVTSMALIFGLDAATATKSTIVSGLLIVALADNLTDALSMHVYEESHRRLAPREAFWATFGNFVARLAV